MENYFQILFIKDRNNYNSLKFLIKQKKKCQYSEYKLETIIYHEKKRNVIIKGIKDGREECLKW